MKRLLQAMVAAAALLGGAVSADPAKLYRWTDENGHVHYSDRVPPEAAHQQHEQLDAHGQPTKVVDREKTPEEYAAEKQKARETEQREQHDKYLLQTYASSDDLVRARDMQLKLLDDRAAATQKTLTNTDATLADLKSRKVGPDSDDPDAQKKLTEEIATFSATQLESSQALAKIAVERKDIQSRFDQELARYAVLRPAPATAPTSAPTVPPTANVPAPDGAVKTK